MLTCLTDLPRLSISLPLVICTLMSCLCCSWYQVGIYYPFFRGHAHLETQRREPWLFGEDTTRRIREAIRGRYMLLPYIYTLFRSVPTPNPTLQQCMALLAPTHTHTFIL